jgi:O-antigen/teichoic acid export membrane protein
MNEPEKRGVPTTRMSNIMRRVLNIGRHTERVDQRVARGGVLVLTTRVFIKVIQFSRTIIIARLLFPHDVGLFALATATLGIADMLIQPGMGSAVIQKEKIDRRHLDTAWTVTVIRSAAIGCIAFVAAPIAGAFFDLDAIVLIIRALAVGIVINGFENIGAVLFVRDIQFHRKMAYDVLMVITETVAIIVAAFVLPNVWALVIGMLVNKVAAIVFSYALHPYRPRFSFDMQAFRELFGFGKWVGVTGIIAYFVAQGDTLTVGRLLGTEAVGYYAFAFGLALMPAIDIARTLGTVLFPHLSRLPQEERGPAFLVMMRTVLLISVPAIVGLALVAEPIVRMLYGEKWLPMLPAFYVLIVYASLRSVSYLIEPLYLSMGRPRVVMTSTTIHLIIMMSAIVPLGSSYGLPGIAGAVLLGAVTSLSYLLFGIQRERVVRLRALVRAAALPIVASCAMAFGLVCFEILVPVVSKQFLILEIILGVVFYAVVLFTIDNLRGGSVRRSLVWLKGNI